MYITLLNLNFISWNPILFDQLIKVNKRKEEIFEELSGISDIKTENLQKRTWILLLNHIALLLLQSFNKKKTLFNIML